jgi:hypothetical protein
VRRLARPSLVEAQETAYRRSEEPRRSTTADSSKLLRVLWMAVT